MTEQRAIPVGGARRSDAIMIFFGAGAVPALVDLFDGQSISDDGWVMLYEAVRAI
jgi:hypothetical protein